MKIEMGESLAFSWLRHVRKCQVVQLNWKPSMSAWSLHGEAGLSQTMENIGSHFERIGMDVFKGNKSYLQLLRQCEIDVLGIELDGGSVANVYGVDVAFHEAGLNYGSESETVSRVVKKAIRSALAISGYLNVNRGTVVFATPKASPAVEEQIKRHFATLCYLARSYGLEFDFQLLANQRFTEQIFLTVCRHAETVADTSELFMRAYQLCQAVPRVEAPWFEREHKENKNRTRTKEDPGIGQQVQKAIRALAASETLSDQLLTQLQDADYCKATLGLNYPMLKLLDPSEDVAIQRKVNSYDRYYARPVTIRDAQYLLCNDWYDRHIPAFEDWLGSIEM